MSSHGGNLKKRAELNKRNGSRSKTKTGQTYRVYCWKCSATDSPISVAFGQKIAICRSGHRITVGSASKVDGQEK